MCCGLDFILLSDGCSIWDVSVINLTPPPAPKTMSFGIKEIRGEIIHFHIIIFLPGTCREGGRGGRNPLFVLKGAALSDLKIWKVSIRNIQYLRLLRNEINFQFSYSSCCYFQFSRRIWEKRYMKGTLEQKQLKRNDRCTSTEEALCITC